MCAMDRVRPDVCPACWRIANVDAGNVRFVHRPSLRQLVDAVCPEGYVVELEQSIYEPIINVYIDSESMPRRPGRMRRERIFCIANVQVPGLPPLVYVPTRPRSPCVEEATIEEAVRRLATYPPTSGSTGSGPTPTSGPE